MCNISQKHHLRQRAVKYCSWEIIFIVCKLCTSLFAISSTPLIPLPLTCNGRVTHEFVPPAVHIFYVSTEQNILHVTSVSYACLFLSQSERSDL
jgi:hypothetical protein